MKFYQLHLFIKIQLSSSNHQLLKNLVNIFLSSFLFPSKYQFNIHLLIIKISIETFSFFFIQVVRIGTKKTSFANFTEICKTLHRQPKHLLDFLLAELGTSGSVDGNSQLIIKGRFQQKQIENVLRRYIKEYVTCHTCRSPDTILQKDTRLFFLQCETCGSRYSIYLYIFLIYNFQRLVEHSLIK